MACCQCVCVCVSVRKMEKAATSYEARPGESRETTSLHNFPGVVKENHSLGKLGGSAAKAGPTSLNSKKVGRVTRIAKDGIADVRGQAHFLKGNPLDMSQSGNTYGARANMFVNGPSHADCVTHFKGARDVPMMAWSAWAASRGRMAWAGRGHGGWRDAGGLKDAQGLDVRAVKESSPT